MSRTFARALRSYPLFFEPVPPSARIAPERAAHQIAAVAEVIRAIPRVDAVNVPELVDENHAGQPYYRSGDARSYARQLVERSGREVVVNKVVAHLPDPSALVDWCQESVRQGLRQLVFTGGSSRYIPYPGPAVVEANRLARPIVDPVGGHLGNVAIPQRTGEAHRMLAKTKAGASFFTTQILFGSEEAVGVLKEYGRLCHSAGVPSVPVLLSFAPLIDERDVEFVRWLGADLPASAERQILGEGPGEATVAAERSVARALEVLAEVQSALRHMEHRPPIGVNVEQITTRHLTHAASLATVIADQLPR